MDKLTIINRIKRAYQSIRIAGIRPTGVLATRALVLVMLVPMILVVAQYALSTIRGYVSPEANQLIDKGILIIDQHSAKNGININAYEKIRSRNRSVFGIGMSGNEINTMDSIIHAGYCMHSFFNRSPLRRSLIKYLRRSPVALSTYLPLPQPYQVSVVSSVIGLLGL